MLAWLAAALDSNGERIKMRPNAAKACTDGFAANLAGVSAPLAPTLLQSCGQGESRLPLPWHPTWQGPGTSSAGFRVLVLKLGRGVTSGWLQPARHAGDAWLVCRQGLHGLRPCCRR